FLFEALGVLQTSERTLELLFPDLKTHLTFRTDYTLKPGEQHLEMSTVLTMDPPPSFGCPDISDCEPCEFDRIYGSDGCPTCACADPLQLEPYTGPEAVFAQLFGDDQGRTNPPPQNRAGVVAGDFVFFGNQNQVFAPGIGFDTDKAVHDAFYAGLNTFQTPL